MAQPKFKKIDLRSDIFIYLYNILSFPLHKNKKKKLLVYIKKMNICNECEPSGFSLNENEWQVSKFQDY